MGLNDRLLDAAIGHQADLSQYSSGVVRRIIATLNETDSQLMLTLAQALDRLPPDSFTVQRLDAMLSSVRNLNAQAYKAAYGELTDEVESLVEFEAKYNEDIFKSLLPDVVNVAAVTPVAVFGAVTAEPFQGRLLSEWFDSLSAGRQQRMRDAIVLGHTQGETIAEIVNRVRGTRAAGYADGILEIDRRHATAVVRTAISHTSAVVRDTFNAKNADLIKSKVWVSTLDLRTTRQFCIPRDGKRYDLNNQPIGHSLPWGGGPGMIHWNCRSTYVVVLKSWEQMGIKPDQISASTRASMDGQVPEDTTYLDWLKRQSASRQDEVLGATRGALFRQGKVSPGQFWQDNGNFLSLDELRARHAKAFDKAGL